MDIGLLYALVILFHPDWLIRVNFRLRRSGNLHKDSHQNSWYLHEWKNDDKQHLRTRSQKLENSQTEGQKDSQGNFTLKFRPGAILAEEPAWRLVNKGSALASSQSGPIRIPVMYQKTEMDQSARDTRFWNINDTMSLLNLQVAHLSHPLFGWTEVYFNSGVSTHTRFTTQMIILLAVNLARFYSPV